MKVLMLGWELPPHNSGGLGVACYQLCKSLSQNNIDLEFILPYNAEHKIDFMKITAAIPQGVSEVILSGIAYDSHKYIFQNGNHQVYGIYDQQYLYENAIIQLIKEREFDIVHAHDWLTFRAAIRIKELKNCPVILHVHSVESDRSGGNYGNPMVREIEELSFHLADRIIAVSELTKQSIIRDYHIPADKIEVIHNSIDPQDLVPLDGQNVYKYLTLMKSLGYRVVVNVGRLTIQKGLTNLLYAAKEVVAKHPKTIFLIVGSGEQHNELIELSASLGIGANVLFTDFQRGKNWRDAFAISDLFVMPSISEPFGLTPLEAIGYGSPVLISKQSGISEKLKNCLKVDFWDIEAMANDIVGVMASDVLRDELWRNSYLEYQNMSWDEASVKVIDLYKSHARSEEVYA
jgi:glycogen(starch) synthase